MNKRSAASGVGWNMAFAAIGKVAFPVVGIFIARSVGAAALGVFAVVSTLFAVIELLREGGLGSTYLADSKIDEGRDRAYAGASVGSGLAFAALLFLGRGWLADFFESPEMSPALAWAALCSALGGFVAIPATRLQRAARFRDLGLADFLASLISYSVGLTMALRGYGFDSLVVQMVLRVLLFGVAVLAISRFVAPSFAGESLRIVRSAASNLAANLSYFVYTTFDYLLIKKVLGDRPNGAYFAAFNIASKPVDLVAGPVIKTVFVAFARAAGDPERQAGLWTRTAGVVALATLPLYGVLGFHGQALIDILYTADFALAGSVLPLLALYLAMRSLGASASSALIGTGRPRLSAIAWLPGFVVAGLGLALAWRNPTLTGFVAALTAGATAVYFVQIGFAFWQLKPGKALRDAMFRQTLGGVAGAAIAGLPLLAPIDPRLRLVASLALVAVVCPGIAAALVTGNWRNGYSKTGWKTTFWGL